MRRRLEKIYEGGGKKAIEKQREKNKLTPRERINYLIDGMALSTILVDNASYCIGITYERRLRFFN